MSTTGNWNAIFPTGTGTGGSILTSTGTGGTTWTTSTSNWYVDNDAKVAERLSKIEERLLILQPVFELHEKYPALKEAYENYRLIEKLVNSQKQDE